jgi:hypothetical protein
MGQEAFSGKTATKRKTEGLHERKTLSTFAAAGTQAGQLPLPHDPSAVAVGISCKVVLILRTGI